MINVIRQKEIEELDKILRSCGGMPVEIAKKLLKKRHKTPEQIDIILNQMVKRKIAFYDTSKTYLLLNKSVKKENINAGITKSLWLMMDLLEQIKLYFIHKPESAETMSFLLKGERDNPFFDVFYAEYNLEDVCVFNINEFAKKSNSEIQAIIIIDTVNQIPKLKALNKNVNVRYFVHIDNETGKVTYYEGE